MLNVEFFEICVFFFMFMHASYDEENKLCYVIVIEK